MATLQNIRNHGVLLAVIIGLALFAFIIGDLLKSGTSMFEESQQTVGVVEDENINIMEFQAKIEQMKQIYEIELGRNDFNEQELTQIRNSVWDNMINSKLLELEAEKIGLTVGKEELKERLLGKDIHPIIQQRRVFSDPNTGKFSPLKVRDFYNNLFGEGASQQNQADLQEAKSYWLFWEKEVKNAILQEKFITLMNKSVGANSIQGKFNFDAHNSVANVNYIVKPYYTVADSIVKVTESELQKKYKKNIELYKQQPNRSIKYVTFNVEPLAEDFEKAAQWIKKIASEFKETNDVIGLVNQESDRSYSAEPFSKQTVPSNLKKFAFSNSTGAIYGPVFENNTYTMARIVKSGIMESDSAKLRHIALRPDQEKKADSLLNAIRKGASFAKIARKHSLVPQTASKGGEIGWINRRELDKQTRKEVFSKKIKKAFKISSSRGIQIFEVLKRTPAKPKVRLAILERKITPSNNSYSKIYNDAKQFAVNGNDAEKFNSVAKEKGYIIRQATNLQKNTETVNRIPQSRQVVKWVFENKKGNVSDVFDCNREVFLVALVDKVNEGEYIDFKTVKPQLKSMLVRDKKAEKIISEIAEQQKKAKNLNDLATAMNMEIKTANNVSFNSYQFGEAGSEPYIIGEASVSSAGKMSKALKGNGGVYVIELTNQSKDNTPYNPKVEIEQINSRFTQSLPYIVLRDLKEKYNVEDNRSRFY